MGAKAEGSPDVFAEVPSSFQTVLVLPTEPVIGACGQKSENSVMLRGYESTLTPRSASFPAEHKRGDMKLTN
jgi:hypothetical protein